MSPFIQTLKQRYWRREALPPSILLTYAIARGVVGFLSDVDWLANHAPWSEIGEFLNTFVFEAWFSLVAALLGVAWLLLLGTRQPRARVVEEERAPASVSGPKAEFYPTREDLNLAGSGLRLELEGVKTAWAAWPVGTHAHTHDIFQRTGGRPQRLILLDPWGEHIKTAAALFDRSPEELASDILITTRLAHRSNVEVHWLDGPITSLLFGDPNGDEGWVRIEIVFVMSVDRPNLKFARRDYPQLYRDLIATYEKMIQASPLAYERIEAQLDLHHAKFQSLSSELWTAMHTDDVDGFDVLREWKEARASVAALLGAIFGNSVEAEFLAAGSAAKTDIKRIDMEAEFLEVLLGDIEEKCHTQSILDTATPLPP